MYSLSNGATRDVVSIFNIMTIHAVILHFDIVPQPPPSNSLAMQYYYCVKIQLAINLMISKEKRDRERDCS